MRREHLILDKTKAETVTFSLRDMRSGRSVVTNRVKLGRVLGISWLVTAGASSAGLLREI